MIIYHDKLSILNKKIKKITSYIAYILRVRLSLNTSYEKKRHSFFSFFYFKFGFYTLKIASRPNSKTIESILAEI